MTIENFLWVEKYRPKTLDEIVMPDELKNKFNEMLNIKRDIPHLLFVGKCGSGKSSIARIIIDTLIKDKSDVMILNGSSKSGIDTIREEIEPFLKYRPQAGDKFKIVFIDEFDRLSTKAQDSLRNIIETYSSNARFICTGNYKNRIVDALISRFQVYDFDTPPKEFIKKYCENILRSEEITYDSADVDALINKVYPDIRKIVGSLQQFQVDNVLKNINADKLTSDEQKIISYLKLILNSIGGKFFKQQYESYLKKIIEILQADTIDYNSVYEKLFNDEDIIMYAKIVINQYAFNHTNAAIPYMHFLAMIMDIVKIQDEYRTL